MEPLTLAGRHRHDGFVDIDELADVAARTFPLACPPATPAENIASFIDTNLSATRFARVSGRSATRDSHRARATAELSVTPC